MSTLMLCLVLAVTAALVTIGWNAGAMLRASTPLPRTARHPLRTAGRRTMTAVAATAATMAAFAVWVGIDPGTAGLPIALAPAVSATVGVGVYSLLPRRSADVAEPALVPRTASLEPRTWWNQGPPLPRVLLGAALATTLALVLVSALTSSVDEHGNPVLYREFDGGAMTAAAGPYPGWIYAGPLLAAITVLAIVTVAAMRRVSTTPALPGPELAEPDRRWRRGSALVVCLISLSGTTLTLAGMMAIVGSAMHRVHHGVSAIWSALGAGLMVGGGLAALGAAAALTLAVLRAVELTRVAVDSSRQPRTAGATGTTGTAGTAETPGVRGTAQR